MGRRTEGCTIIPQVLLRKPESSVGMSTAHAQLWTHADAAAGLPSVHFLSIVKCTEFWSVNFAFWRGAVGAGVNSTEKVHAVGPGAAFL